MIDGKGVEVNEQGLGKRQRHALEFIRSVDGWHSYAKDVANVVRSLALRGLVEYAPASRQFRATYPMKCDQCSWCRVNGVFCHEQGCPNERKRFVQGEWILFLKCRECGFDVQEGEYCGCCPETGGEYFDEEPMDVPEESEVSE